MVNMRLLENIWNLKAIKNTCLYTFLKLFELSSGIVRYQIIRNKLNRTPTNQAHFN